MVSKLAEFDFEGWHADPYIAREFHGVWEILMSKLRSIKLLRSRRYRLLTKQNEIGFGYQDQGVVVNVKSKTLTWHFNAPMVHDFTWAADRIIFTMWRKDLMVSTSISCIKQPTIYSELEKFTTKNNYS
jgi:hypothetical protein